ncbi:MAG: GlsB/YeaQ/YmgE family stress response membrane protein [bacterium]
MENVDPKQIMGFLEALGGMGIAGTIIIGFLAGAAAKLIMPGKDPGGLILTTVLGIGGASLGTYLGQRFDVAIPGEASGFITAVMGAFLILLAYRVVFRRAG